MLFTSLGGTTWAWGSPQIIGLIVLSIVLLPTFVLVESRAEEPILPLSLFRNRTFATTSAVGFIVGFALFGAVTFLPLYLQVTKGSSPTRSGLELTPLMGGLLVTSIVSGNLITRWGKYRPFPIVGTARDGGRPVPALAARGRHADLARADRGGRARPRPRRW